MPTHKPNWQAIVLAVALALWALLPLPSIAVMLVAYLIALIAVNAALPYVSPSSTDDSASAKRRRLVWLLILMVPSWVAVRVLWEASPWKQLTTIGENLSDRLALESVPAIAPVLLVDSQPQRFFIYAPASRRVTVRFTSEAPPLATTELGNGVYLLDFDPQQDRVLQSCESGELTCTLTVDDRPYQRKILFARGLPHPRWLRSSPTAGLAVTVSEETDELILVRRGGNHQLVKVADGPTDCVLFDAGRKVAVAHRYSTEVWIVDAETAQVVDRRETGRCQVRMAVAPDESMLAVATDGAKPEIRLFHLPALESRSAVPLSFSPDWLEFGQDASELVVSDRLGRALHKLPLPTAEAAAVKPSLEETPANEPILFPRAIVALGRAADGSHLLLATTASPVGPHPIMANHFIENTLHRVDLANWQVNATQITDRRGTSQDGPGNVEHGTSPIGFASSGGEWLVAMAGSNEVAVVPPSLDASSQYFLLDDHPLTAPHGVADLGEGVWAVSSPSDSTIGLYHRSGEFIKLVQLAEKSTAGATNNSIDADRIRGEQAFYAGTRAGISCQSCHVHGDRDSGLFDIGQAFLVDVLSVRGVAGTSPYLRDASYWQLRDLHDVARVGYRGYRHDVPWDRAEMLATFVQHLPLPVHARQLETPDVARLKSGVGAFFKAECASCHTPPALTNLGQHPNKLLFPREGEQLERQLEHETMLDTPSLRAVSQTPPYLHDGRAATLRAVLVDHNRDNRHGNVKSLSPAELDNLLYFLEQL